MSFNVHVVHEGFCFVGHLQLVCKCIRRWYCNCLMCSSNTYDTPVKKITQPLNIDMKLQASNRDFGTIKGLTIAYDLRRTGNIRMTANYTLQFAEGTGSDATSAAGLINAGLPNLRNIFPYYLSSIPLLFNGPPNLCIIIFNSRIWANLSNFYFYY